MVSTQTSYMRRISPPKYRRQTLQIFDIYGDQKSDLTSLPSRPASALDRKWVHRSLGDLTSDSNFINSHPRLQTDFYQDLLRKYPQAFTRRRNAREAGRKLFNSRPHVRFEDEEMPLVQKSKSSVNLYKDDNHMTNWDREVGPYIRSNSRECFTSVEPSECSGSVLSLKQRLHINSVTLNKLLHEKSPLRRKFEKDRIPYDSGTENEQTLEEYFLDKSRQRSRNRVKHRRVLQRRINNNTANNEQNKQAMHHRRWISKSVSPTSKHMYSLPADTNRSTADHASINRDVDSVIRDSDLKIDTLLEKIGSKLSGPDSPPDSAIDIDTPSVQSFVSSEKVMTSDNLYQVSIDMSEDNKSRDFESQSSPESSPNMFTGDSPPHRASAIVNNSAINVNHSISYEGQISMSNDNHTVQSEHTGDYINSDQDVPIESPGLLQLYTQQLMPELFNNKSNDMSTPGDIDNTTIKFPEQRTTIEQDRLKSYKSDLDTHTDNMTCEVNGEIAEAADAGVRMQKENQGTNADQDCTENRIPTIPPRNRQKKRTKGTDSTLPSEHPSHPERSDLDTSILDEIQFEGMSHDLNGRESHSDNIDDTDVRLGVLKVSSQEARIAEKYYRTRSPSPFVIKNRKTAMDRPKSAPLFGTDRLEMRIVDIPLTGSNGRDKQSKDMPNTHVDLVKQTIDETCQINDINDVNHEFPSDDEHDIHNVDTHHIHSRNKHISDTKNEHDINGGNRHDIIADVHSEAKSFKKKSCVQNCDSKILVSSSQVKQRNVIAIATSSRQKSHSSAEDENTPVDSDEENVSVVSNRAPDSNGQINRIFDGNSTSVFTAKDIHLESEDSVKQGTQIVSARKGYYKPSVTSPRTNEKRMKLRSLLKTKKGSYSPAPMDDISDNDIMKDTLRQAKPHSSLHEGKRSQHLDNDSSERSNPPSPISRSNKTMAGSRPNVSQQHVNEHKVEIHDEIKGKPDRTNINNGVELDSDTESDVQTVKAISVKHPQGNISTAKTGHVTSSQESLPRTSNIPPVKPARTKHKKLPQELNLSQYKIMPNGEEVLTHQLNSLSNKPETGTAQMTSGPSKQGEHMTDERKPFQKVKEPNDTIEVLGPQMSNLKGSKPMSASKGSLLGGFKSATRGKLKSLKKAMSLDKGMDKAGAVTFPDPNQGDPDNDPNVPKMKKAPSLKSITSLFGRKKKKKGKLNSEGAETASTHGSCQSLSSGQTGSSDHQQTGLPPVKPGTSSSKPIGKLQSINPDGTQLIQLIKPQTGPIGFFIAKGSAKYKNGIFISRFTDPKPEKVFGGLLSVGDEILEVNGHFVRDLSQDDVYDIISASPIVVMKIFPFIARKDI